MPDMCEGALWDVGGLLTMVGKFQNEVKFKFWYPTHVEQEKWDLYPDKKFGYGTTYDNRVYHAFESRLSSAQNSFIKKCKEILAQA
jgi:hypothetical protein